MPLARACRVRVRLAGQKFARPLDNDGASKRYQAKGFFPDRQRPLVKGLSLCVLALIVAEYRQVVEDTSCVAVLRAQRLFRDRQGPLVKGLHLRVFVLGVVERR